MGDRANCFAVGYDDGSILVWGIPAPAFKLMTSGKASTAPLEAVLILSLRVVPEGTLAAPIRSLTFMPGSPSARGAEDRLLVCGGQNASDPDMLTLLPLEQDGGAAPLTVPWFGVLKAHAVMPRAGSLGRFDSEALMLLTEGGQLVVHDLREWQPQPLTLPFQELPPITLSIFVPTLSESQVEDLGTASLHALSLPALHAAARARRNSISSTSTSTDWPFTGGEPASIDVERLSAGCHPSALLLTGHRDGRVRVWDATTQVPTLLETLPSSTSGGQERLRSVTALDACPMSGLVAVGHAAGEVRVYQFSNRTQPVRCASLDESLVPYDTQLTQRAGFQYLLRYSGTHSSDVTSVALTSALRMLAVGDAAGNASVVDLAGAQRILHEQPVQNQGIAKLVFAMVGKDAFRGSPPPSAAAGRSGLQEEREMHVR